jgi:hypothetical protein
MPRSILSRKKAILLFVVATCLITALIAAWRIYPLRAQTSGPIQAPQEGKRLSRMIDNLKSSGAQFRAVELLQTEQAPPLTSFVSSDELKQGVTLNFNSSAAAQLSANDNQAITLRLPDPQGTLEAVELELVRVNIFAKGFTVTTSSSNGAPVDYQPGLHFRGAVKGAPGSLAAVSVFKDEVAGLYSLPGRGNFVLGKLTRDNPTNSHVLYSEADLKQDKSRVCGVKDDNTIIPLQDLQDLNASQIPEADGCVRVFVEADHDMFLDNGGNRGFTVNYITALFNQSATIFANDGIWIMLSGTRVRDTEIPYDQNQTDPIQILQEFQANNDPFDGDIAHLVAFRGYGGAAADYDTLCNPDPDMRKCVTAVGEHFQNFPTYSRAVKVFTHEIGHLMGSRHTHACVWNGNGTAIDSCGSTEGGCSALGIPGTIMSYCDPDIDYSLGFGPQPGNLIRNRISVASCIGACDSECIYGISPTSLSFPPSSGSGSFTVSPSNGGCNWTAVSNNSFITITSGSSGLGAGTINFSVAQNGTTPRTGTISVGGNTFTVSQSGCTYTINPTSSTFLAGGGSGTVSVTTPNGCNWTAVSNSSFITITSGASGSGNGTVSYSVTPNSATSSRSGTITIAGKTFTISQAGNSSGELIVNGGFESGLSPWRLTGNAYRSTGAYPYSGNAYAVVIDGNSETGSVSQPITIPSGALRDLTFRLNVSSQETSQFTAYDTLIVEVLYRDGSFLLRRTLAQFSNLNKGSAGVYSLRGPYWLDDFAGQTVDIQFRAVSDSSLPTYFRIDNVSVRPPPPGN